MKAWYYEWMYEFIDKIITIEQKDIKSTRDGGTKKKLKDILSIK